MFSMVMRKKKFIRIFEISMNDELVRLPAGRQEFTNI
jgi:hypothetical protein